MTPKIRPARLEDLPALTQIYNHYVVETPITFDIEPFSVEARRSWFDQFAETGRHRLLVAERDGRVDGYACSQRFRAKPAYDVSVEVTIYLRDGVQRQGLGTGLYGALFEALRGEEIHRFYAGVTLPNPASIALHARFFFRPLAVFSQVGRKFGRYWDVSWYEKRVD